MSPHHRRRAAWIVIASGCTIVFITFGVRGGFGLFMAPISADLGWGREIFALSLAIQNLIWGLAQPFAGMVADRFGSGRVLVAGGIAYGAGVLLMAESSDPLAMHMTAGVLVGLGLGAGGFGVVLAAVGRVVSEKHRTAALGLVTAAGSLGQFVMTPLGQAFLAAYGWQTALMLLGIFAFAIVPLAAGVTGRPAAEPGQDQTLRDALRQAGGNRSYILLTSGFFVCGFQIAFIAAHFPAYIDDLGLPGALGGWALALIGLFNVVGSYGAGLLGGRYRMKYLLSLLYVLRAAAVAIFMLVPASTASVLVFSSVMGLLWLSTVPLTSGLVALMFGVRYLATLFGFVFLSHQLGSFLGVWLGGYLYDSTGSYDVVWWLGVALGLVAAALHWPIREAPITQTAPA